MSSDQFFDPAKSTETTAPVSRENPPPAAEATTVAWCSSPGWGLGAMLLVGVLAWFLVQPANVYDQEGADQWGFLPPEQELALRRTNAIYGMALLGGLAGMGLAAGEGLARRSWLAALGGAVACGLLGAGFGAAGGLFGHMMFEYQKLNHAWSDLTKTILTYTTMFTIAGGGAALAAGAILARRLSTVLNGLIGGILAGALAALVYPVIVAVLMPGVQTNVLIPVENLERTLWLALFFGLMGVILPTVVRGSTHAKPTGDPHGSHAGHDGR